MMRRGVYSLIDLKLCHLASARQLASSAAILSASVQMRKDLSRLLTIFKDNAACLFPKHVTSQAHVKTLSRPRSSSLKPGPEDIQKTPSNRSEHPGIEFDSLPKCMATFAHNVSRLKLGLAEYTEFTDESLDEILTQLIADFSVRLLSLYALSIDVYGRHFSFCQYWASRLLSHKGITILIVFDFLQKTDMQLQTSSTIKTFENTCTASAAMLVNIWRMRLQP